MCDTVATDSGYARIDSSNLVATTCKVNQCGESVDTYCIFNDYIQDVHGWELLFSSACVTESTRDYCDFDKYREALYCESEQCVFLDLE